MSDQRMMSRRMSLTSDTRLHSSDGTRERQFPFFNITIQKIDFSLIGTFGS